MTTHGIRPYRVSSRIWMISLALATSLLATSALAEPPAGTEKAGQAQHTLLVNLNTADEGQLTALPGIGPSKARAILKLRTRMKRFRRIEDLMRVRGVGRKTFRRQAAAGESAHYASADLFADSGGLEISSTGR